MALPVLNTRADLDAIGGTTEPAAFMDYLRGSLTRQVDTQTYPEGYGQPGYEGDPLPPVWTEVEDLTTINRFGFTKDEVLGE
ncbi:MAG: hypothetical protein VB138_01170 [Burkholderia sp.]